jgi:excinuclease ABC subunit A
MEPTHISIRNARVHNLRGVDLDVPRHQLVVFTGVSGSGKSSLAHDTIYKEGQRRFMESLSAYARQFLGDMERPPVDAVDGISPTLSIDQKTVNRNPRSTVGTVTELYDHLRLLFARLGTPHCPECGEEVSRLSVDQVVDRLLDTWPDERVLVLGPLVRDRKGEYRKELEALQRDGWARARVDGSWLRLEHDELPTLARYEKHTIEVVVDRLVLRSSDRSRLAEAVEEAVRLGQGVVTVVRASDDAEQVFSTQRACPRHPEVNIPELEPRLFSFNAPQGACPTCNGLGRLEAFSVDKLIDPEQPLAKGFRAFNDDGKLPFARFSRDDLKQVLKKLGVGARTPLVDLTPTQRTRLLYGDRKLMVTQHIDHGGRKEKRVRPYKGLMPMVETVWHYTKHKPLEAFRERSPCPDCQGARLNAVARHVTFRGEPITTLSGLSVGEAEAWFRDLVLEGEEREIGTALLQEIQGRLGFLAEVGLGYLTLDRGAATLSGGEAQRIRLAAQVGSALQGVTYILDEPSIGLHPRDNLRLLEALRRLRDRGNSVLVVEHDAETILAADWVVDVGPGAGRRGGEVMASTTPGRLMRSKKSRTAAWLRGEARIEVPSRRKPSGALGVKGAKVHNLKRVDVDVPLGCLTVVTGVSGSGKSSLVFHVVEPSVRNALRGEAPVNCRALKGVKAVDKLVRISQTPIGRTPRSNPATYTGVFDYVRSLFAQVPEARARGYKKGRFSFNVAGGRCEACEGAGVRVVEMQFLPSVEVPCEVCDGTRFNRETLEITFKGKSIADVLAMTIDEALEFFAKQPKIRRILATLSDVGLDYVALGQPSTTLSGGEAQRVKLASELHRPGTGQTLYLLDEPTTGLHFDDVAKLIASLQRLVDAGNSVVVVEHHTDLIKVADRLVDMGPEGGDGGGTVVGQGTPEEVAALDTPTGRTLAALPELQVSRGLLAAEEWVPYEVPARSRRTVRRPSALTVKGAKVHNLREVDVEVPHGKMTVISGVSGSGKTSLAFDTIFAEGQRQYVESLSTYARRFLGRLERAPVDRLEGLQPAIAIDQKSASHNPRSTVATVTEIHDVLRLLYARVGTCHCPVCRRVVRPWSPSEVAADLAEANAGSGWLTAPLAPASEPEPRRDGLITDGWQRLLHDGEQLDLSDERAVTALAEGTELVIDRLAPGRDARARTAEAVDTAFALGGGVARFRERRGDGSWSYATRATCPEHGVVHEIDLTPRHFSFNSKLGACPRCDGVGVTTTVVRDRLLPEPSAGFFDALDPRVSSVLSRSARNRALVAAVLARHGHDLDTPVARYTDAALEEVLEGVDEELTLRWSRSWGRVKREVVEERRWAGVLALLDGWSSRLDWLTTTATCPRCRGGRLRAELQAVTLEGLALHELTGLPVERVRDEVAGWSLQGAKAVIAERPLEELRRRLGFLVDVGLGYLALDRPAETLSGGEAQRIRLASQLGSSLTGVTYVLDEPTVGLHPRDTERLLGTLEGLRDAGNTVLLVEHDPDTIARADHVIDMGPAAGVEGGQVVAVGSPKALARSKESPTGRWLAGIEQMPSREAPRAPRAWLGLRRVEGHNLKGFDVKVPTGVWVAVAGVSGSGKSTLIMDTLAPALQAHLGAEVVPASHQGLELGEGVDRVVVVDQSPIGRTPRSTPATYTKAMDALRTLYARTTGAMERGWKPGRFSYNSPSGGRCTVCEGRGSILVEMHFLPDVWVECEACGGRRYDRETLAVRWKGKSIADVLSMRCDEAQALFRNHRKLNRILSAMVDVGLGYLTLGQPATTLSGGEAQRVKLASELSSRRGHAVYVLDEPTTGLHLSDVRRLVQVLHRLVDQGHTVITIEHHLDMLRQADWVLELGPEGGEAGGRLISEGTPAEVARADTPTGAALATS